MPIRKGRTLTARTTTRSASRRCPQPSGGYSSSSACTRPRRSTTCTSAWSCAATSRWTRCAARSMNWSGATTRCGPPSRSSDGTGYQVVAPPTAPVPVVDVVDLRSVPPHERAAALRACADEQARTPFDLQRGPLLRVGLLRPGRRLPAAGDRAPSDPRRLGDDAPDPGAGCAVPGFSRRVGRAAPAIGPFVRRRVSARPAAPPVRSMPRS